MAVLTARTIMEVRNETKNIHPFFEKRAKAHDDSPTADRIICPVTAAMTTTKFEDSDLAVPPIADNSLGPSRRKGEGKLFPVYPKKMSKKTKEGGGNTFQEQVAELLEVDPNINRRKRQKSASPRDERLLGISNDRIKIEGEMGDTQPTSIVTNGHIVQKYGIEYLEAQPLGQMSAYTELEHPVMAVTPVEEGHVRDMVVAVGRSNIQTGPSGVPNTLGDESASNVADSAVINSSDLGVKRPQKTLRLNPKTGTIGSPPAKSIRLSSGTGAKKRLGRSSMQIRSLVVTIRYGHDSETRSNIGNAINDLLCGAKTYATFKGPLTNVPGPLPQPGLAKSTHPFFLGKVSSKASPPNSSEKFSAGVLVEKKPSSVKSTMTLGEAKNHSPIRERITASSNAAFHHFGNSTQTLKFPGAVEVCWPPKGMVHIKAMTESRSRSHASVQNTAPSTQKKSKYIATETLEKDNILNVLAMKLDIDEVLESLKHVNAEDFAEPERSLRLPEKHFENGYQIQRRVRRELSLQSPYLAGDKDVGSSEDELQRDDRKAARINPSLLNIYRSLPTSLTEFDRSRYETLSWIHKYSPYGAAEVLQCGREPYILKEWLQKLTIIAVDTGASESQSRAGTVAPRRSGLSGGEKSGKKKRRPNKLEGFVISSAEEGDDMDEISDLEDDWSPQRSQRPFKKTVIRSGDKFKKGSRDTKRYKNAIVISGPSGCGKTAMIYGVAKELGYEVFEINSSSRRSGKEIIERVGDMTRNHLVQCSEITSASAPQDEDLQRISDAFTADLKSGRQGTMNSFFKPKKSVSLATESTKPKMRRDVHSTADGPKPSKASPKQQKQSLILLEEVDVLFEEDKQFWSTVINLIAQSKRPVIMTCNDEALLPLQDLELHAIIRLSPPPPDVAVDYLLLVAAAEGHIVKRNAVRALYNSRHFDLRAALTELDYWCQLGIGDRKGGLEWFYPRWPPGCDVDEHGHTIRVVSEGTYRTGMGWLGRDLAFESSDEKAVREEALHEAWNGWNIDFDDWHECLDMVSPMERAPRDSRIMELSSYEAFAESMSMADICACGSLAAGNKILLDTSSPPLSAKVRDDFVIGYELLQADTLDSYDKLDKDISIWIKFQARELLQYDNRERLKAPLEAQISAKITSFGQQHDDSISRNDFSAAFDPIAEPERNTLQSTSSLEPSVFDRTTSTIAVDVAPYVRSIVAYDAKLQQERVRLSNLLSEGGGKNKRLRTTRSALSALEGSARKTTRPERYFRVALNPHLVNKTGLQRWQEAVAAEMSDMEAREAREKDLALDSIERDILGMSESP